MIRDQCSAYCQCAYCANKESKDGNAETNVLRFTKKDAADANMTKDELYAKSLHDSIRTRALLSSTKNASKFIPDEQLLSSTKRREAKEASVASQLVPLRRRDRLEELLLLEHKARLREEARLRAERRAAGIADEDEAEVFSAQPTPVASVPQTPASVASSQKRLSGASTPASACSAEHDLRAALRDIKAIVEAEPATGAQQPLSRDQIVKLRQLVHNQDKKSRAQVEACEKQPHLCNHCFSVNVQARHLCPQMTGSVAFAQTGKVINPEDGVKFGTDSKRGLDGTYSAGTVDQRMLSSKAGVSNYNPHPYGTGMVFLPLQTTGSEKPQQASTKSVRFEPTFNNNIGTDEAVESELQYPGSTYNVYDERTDGAANQDGKRNVMFVDSGNSNPSSRNSLAGAIAPSAAVAAAAPGKAASAAGPVSAADLSSHKTTSSLWRTTNQVRDADMSRFLEFQKTMHSNSKKVYESSASRNVAN